MKYFFLLILVLLVSCSKNSTAVNSSSTEMNSSSIVDKEKRISALMSEINEPSEILDAEFLLFNVNGFTHSRASLPGASGWDYKFVVRIDSSNIDKWIDNRFFRSNNFESEWADKLIKSRDVNWETDSEPEYYRTSDSLVFLIVYRKECIIYKRFINFS